MDYSDTWLMTNGHVFDILFGGEAKHVYGASQKAQMIDEREQAMWQKWNEDQDFACFVFSALRETYKHNDP